MKSYLLKANPAKEAMVTPVNAPTVAYKNELPSHLKKVRFSYEKTRCTFSARWLGTPGRSDFWYSWLTFFVIPIVSQ